MVLQLRKLEAYGFKSFADKLEIEFDQGITAIVGPNGSGKSNITDAIKWVLGEQNIRNLRGTRTEDIIFSGSATRKALGIAEVSLTFDNSDGQLALDFKEVVVTRRIFRSGESEYCINKARCRLKDIHDLFADTGLGRDAISVISQNKIDQVLNSKPEERRLLFEEAAGITKYRNRKKESLKKLEDTEQNILRVTDIISEVENQLEPLAEHAQKTRQFNHLNEQFRLCKLTILLNDYDQFHHDLIECKKQKLAIEQVNHDTEIKLNLVEVAKEQLNNEMIEVEKSLQLLAMKNNELNVKIEKNNNMVAVFEERLRQWEEHQVRLSKDIDIKNQNLQRVVNNLKLIADEIQVQQKKADNIQENLTQELLAETALSFKIRALEVDIVKMKEITFQKIEELANQRNRLENLNCNLTKSAEFISNLKSDKELAEKNFHNSEKDIFALQKSADENTKIAQITQTNKAQLNLQINQMAKEREQVDSELKQVNQELNTARTHLHFLIGMQEEYEGFGRATKRVLKNNYDWNAGICGAVAELIQVEKQYIMAIEITLGGNLQNIVTENDLIAKQAIAFLKREKLGRATFLPLNTITNRGKMTLDKSISAFDGFIGCASDLVDCDQKYKKIIEFLLGRTVVVDHIDHAVKLASLQNFKIRIITLDGEMINPGGSMTGGSNARREVSFLNRVGEIDELKHTILLSQKTLEVKEQYKQEIHKKLNVVDEQFQSQIRISHELAVKQAEIKIYIEKAELELIDRKKDLTTLLEQIDQQENHFNQLQIEILHMQSAIKQVESMDNLQKDDDKNASVLLLSLNEDKEVVSNRIIDIKIKNTVIEQEIIRAKEKQESFQSALDRYQDERDKLITEFENLKSTMNTTNIQLENITKENLKVMHIQDIGMKDYDNFHQIKLDKLVVMQDNDKAIKDLRKKYNDLQNKNHEIDILYTRYLFEVNSCKESIDENYKISMEEANQLRLEENNTILNERIQELESDMKALGSINPNAIAEHQSLNDRYIFMKKQANDLIVAKDYLFGIIRDIDLTMSKQFAEAFEKINAFFGDIFIKLFGGGQAELVLSDHKNLLDSGIEINVQPPDKKLQNLSALSGGERALTVVALLFSFLAFKPAPFSVIDEIDAPLDEANVDRFSLFLKEYAKDTQFIVVTHRKGTMQAADILHGVTVEDTGVSRVVSVKMEE